MGHVKKDASQLMMLQKELEELTRFFPGDDRSSGRGEQVHVPHVDMYETGNHLYIDVDLPGVKKEDVNCNISNEEVFVEARKKISRPEKSAHYYCMERFFGFFRRTIDIPVIVNTGDVEAKLVDGILHIKLPKINDRRVKKRKIEIK